MTDEQEALLNQAADALMAGNNAQLVNNRAITALTIELQHSWKREEIANELVKRTRMSFNVPRFQELERVERVWQKLVDHIRESHREAVQTHGGGSTSATVFANLLPMIDGWNDYIEGGDASVESSDIGPT